MRFFTFSEILISLLYYLGFGAVFGFFASVLSVLLLNFKSIIEFPIKLVRIYKNFSLGKIKEEIPSGSHEISGVYLFLRDFFAVLVFGVSFSLVTYVATDGVFRLFALALSCAAAYLTNKTLGRLFEGIVCKLFLWIYSVLLAVSSVIFYPIFKLSALVARIISPLIAKIRALLKKIKPKKKVQKNGSTTSCVSDTVKVYKF